MQTTTNACPFNMGNGDSDWWATNQRCNSCQTDNWDGWGGWVGELHACLVDQTKYACVVGDAE